MYRQTCAQILSRDLSLLISSIYLKLCLKTPHRRGPWPSLCVPLKGNACHIPTQPTIAKLAKLSRQSHDLPQMLKPPLAQLHLNWDVPCVSKGSHGDLEKGFNWDTSWNPSQPEKLDHHNSHMRLMFPPSSRGRKEWQNTNQRKDSIESCRYTNTMMVLNYTTFNPICQKNQEMWRKSANFSIL